MMLVVLPKKAMPCLFAAVLSLSLCWIVKISSPAIAGTVSVAHSTSDDEDLKWYASRRMEFQGYEFRVEQYGKNTVSAERLRLYRDGVEIFAVADGRITLEALVLPKIGQRKIESPAKIGMDITGDGHPNAIIETYSGGAHCCYTYYILDIGETFRLVGEFYGGDFLIQLQNLDKKPGYEVEFWDGNFAY